MRRACLYCGENHGPGKDCKEERQQKEDRKHNESLTPDPELETVTGWTVTVQSLQTSATGKHQCIEPV